MRWARWAFGVAAGYGLALMPAMYFLEGRISREQPPAITHPEYYYGFVGVTLAWQVLFALIAGDPARYRPVMPIAVLEKATFAVAVPVLYVLHRVVADALVFSAIDVVLGVSFLIAYFVTPAR
jgi:hypothetical protein